MLWWLAVTGLYVPHCTPVAPPFSVLQPPLTRAEMPQIDNLFDEAFIREMGRPNITCNWVETSDIVGRQDRVNAEHVHYLSSLHMPWDKCSVRHTPKTAIEGERHVVIDGNHHVSAYIAKGLKRFKVYTIHNLTFDEIKRASDATFGANHRALCAD